MSELDDLMDKYEQRFGEMIPLCVVRMSEDELKTVLHSCIKTDKAYELPDDIKKLLSNPKIQF